MVAQSVSRDPWLRRTGRVGAALFGLVATLAGQARAEDAQVERETVVIDLSKGSEGDREKARAEANAAIAANKHLTANVDRDLNAALAGEIASGSLRRGREASQSLASLGCAEAGPLAELAVLELAAAEAAGENVRADLITAYAASFRCALESGRPSDALARAQTLRRLGQADPPSGVDAATWALYPEIDAAANVSLAELTIESTQAGATIFVDHVRRGVAPQTLHVPQGRHIVGVAAAAGVASKTVDIQGWRHTETLTPEPAVGRWRIVAKTVSDIRAGGQLADAEAIGRIMEQAGARYALVLVGGGTIEAWSTSGGRATRLGQRRNPAQAAAVITREGVRAPDPDVPLLRETDAERAARRGGGDDPENKPAKWWVYAAVVGAAAIGAGLIVFGQSGDERQRFEITLP